VIAYVWLDTREELWPHEEPRFDRDITLEWAQEDGKRAYALC
jgi:hypothetical protein